MKIVKIALIYLAALVVCFGVPCLVSLAFGWSPYRNEGVVGAGATLSYVACLVVTFWLTDGGHKDV